MKTVVYIDDLLDEVDMTKLRQQKRQRNWVAKNNFNRPVRHRAQTDYRRHERHRDRELREQDI